MKVLLFKLLFLSMLAFGGEPAFTFQRLFSYIGAVNLSVFHQLNTTDPWGIAI